MNLKLSFRNPKSHSWGARLDNNQYKTKWSCVPFNLNLVCCTPHQQKSCEGWLDALHITLDRSQIILSK